MTSSMNGLWLLLCVRLLDASLADAVEARMRSRVRAGLVPVAELEQLVDDAPEREHRWALLMLGLYRDGRQAEALRAFDRGRTELADRFGIDPGANLVTLQRAILDQVPASEYTRISISRLSRCQTTPTYRADRGRTSSACRRTPWPW